jgi:hypothetical protein
METITLGAACVLVAVVGYLAVVGVGRWVDRHAGDEEEWG